MKRHILSLFVCCLVVMQLSADREHPIYGKWGIPVPGWKKRAETKKAPQKEAMAAEQNAVPVVSSTPASTIPATPERQLFDDVSDDGKVTDRAHIVYNKGGEKDGTSVIVDLEPQETKDVIKALKPVLTVAAVTLSLAAIGTVLYFGVPAIKQWSNRTT